MKTTTGPIKTYSFTDNLIEQLGELLHQDYIREGKDLSRIALVFGGKRPAMFLKRELARRLGASFYPPPIFTIDEFMRLIVEKTGSFRETKDLDTCYLMCQLAKRAAPQLLKGRETFAQFLPWTREILKFIDNLDLENVDDTALKNIQSNAEIGYAVPEDINRLLQSMVALRQAYHQVLADQNICSRGLQYLRASQVIGNVRFEQFDEILFCNFFYFHRTEEAVVKKLYERGQVRLIFQGDERQWPVLERSAKRLGISIREREEIAAPQFDLQLYAAFDTHAEVGLVREILKKTPKDQLAKTVIVLPHPDLIIPLVSEISEMAEEFNISMGYPLKRSSLFSLFEFVFQAQSSRKDGRYYARDYLKALRHPFVKNLKLAADPTVTRTLIHKIEEILMGKERTSLSGSLFVSLQELETSDDLYALTKEMLRHHELTVTRDELGFILRQIHEILFVAWEGVQRFKDFAYLLGEFLDLFVEKSPLKNYPLNLNIATKMYAIKEEFEQSAFQSEPFSPSDIFYIFQNKIEGEIIAFHGSPLKGLQVLGLLETRSLNFENVIVVDVNEGSLPHLNLYEPLIPREVMISLNLDRLELEEEIQRYQFMRLIASAKKVYLIYQENKEKEKSRFVEELIWEAQKKGAAVVPVTRPSFEVQVVPHEILVEKTPEMIECLRRHTYSASSINMYLRDPMEFYTNYVLGLREEDDLLDEPEARHVGTFIHELLEESFKPFLGKKPIIDTAFRHRVEKIFKEKFEQTFGKTMKSDSFLLRAVIEERLKRFWENEQTNPERAVEEILYLESRFSDAIALSCGEIQFGYVVDRVDRLQDGTIMIVDYKTGHIDQMPKAIDRIASMELSREAIRDTVRSFQIPLYFHYLNQQFSDQPINAALYSLRTMEFKKFIDPKMNDERQEIDAAFLRALDFVVSEILDPNVDFVAERDKVGV